ncbi:hypothetical protein IU470_08100 [Nocardia abscessus]|uniref:Uncharacterized protein n=1 Tax=Nocardia abscessus TaxID=120957 RepID=A0ABS0C3W1_9NOCA|nr:hypothetical protein [Nocardia abscessus]MBF6225070.1 hypothetical protein [Nocardia abscessus]
MMNIDECITAGDSSDGHRLADVFRTVGELAGDLTLLHAPLMPGGVPERRRAVTCGETTLHLDDGLLGGDRMFHQV